MQFNTMQCYDVVEELAPPNFPILFFRSYFVTFLFPSTALMPLEYCLPLMDVADTVEDLDFLESYRAYVKERTGVEMIIES
jgi:hypothetical protein